MKKIMTNKLNNLISSLALIAGLAVTPFLLASDTADVSKDLAGSTAQELPAKAAGLVAKASAADKQFLAAAVVKAAVGLNPSIVVAIVSSVARENPTTAPVAAVTAATLQHKRIGLIAKAAAVAAPSEAAKIVAALIKEFPRDYGIIALAAAEGAPKAGREILAAVADTVPSLQPYIQATMANFTAANGDVPIQAILSQSYNQAVASGVVMPPTLLSDSAAKASAYSQTTPIVSGVPTFSPPILSPPVLGAPFTSTNGVINYTNGSGTVSNEAAGTRYATP